MSTDRVVRTCAVCGGDRTSVAGKGVIYCVDCNRIYTVYESDIDTAEHGMLAAETVRRAA